MATKTVVQMTDDLDGESEAAETVRFSLDGTQYEIDLTEAHATELREDLGRYIDAARNAGRAPAAKKAKSDRDGGPSAKDVRAWAAAQGIEVNARGRLRPEVVEQYLAAN